MYILWAGLTLLYGYSFLDTYFVQGDSGGIVMGLRPCSLPCWACEAISNAGQKNVPSS